jgi:enoyl-CoA hydratase
MRDSTTDKLTSASYKTIAVERNEADHVAIVKLNRPDRLNALDVEMISELQQALSALERDAAIAAVVLTGAGERAFCAGADISGFKETRGALKSAEIARRGQRLTLLMEQMGTAVVAAINGFALGGGMELAMAADIRIAADHAKFSQPEVNLGIMPGFGGTQRSARLLGRGWAMYLCLTGEQIDAAEALRIGLVQRVTSKEALLEEALRIAKLIASKAPLAVAAVKRAIDEGLQHPATSLALEIEALHFGAVFDTEDAREGVAAFFEKRRPEFKGR